MCDMTHPYVRRDCMRLFVSICVYVCLYVSICVYMCVYMYFCAYIETQDPATYIL